MQELTKNIEKQIKAAERMLQRASSKKTPKTLAESTTDEKSSSKVRKEKLQGNLQPIAARILMKVLYTQPGSQDTISFVPSDF